MQFITILLLFSLIFRNSLIFIDLCTVFFPRFYHSSLIFYI